MRLAGKIGAALAAGLMLAGCGSSSDDGDKSSTFTVALPQADGKECSIKVDGAFGEAPKITIPDNCTPPTELFTKDLVTGTGPGAAAGQPLKMNYTLVTWSDKKKLDSSFDRGTPFTLTLGGGQVIKGWDQGLVGVQQGTRRLLVIPPNLGYGQGGNGIKPNETLVFVTDAVKVG
ncbi:FKBP-type peptidyl-prolyl cis-trans isomerase [Nocardia yamanashiensis]|uniref:FKBP-type peptidyl-prolyl cis-trans isomerase n=1 Tax=Nocardia yamanashiensis TaxID=209247 RepID=UPI00083136E3|nr:FKBP-type peptidyl-prolyl cis-trans isomerase [Nocardia yamanashiensis]UGT41690.1 FKBP-type peptidyl-prolyl cis-trans isomerase [Nocardia yamanashiensis]